MHCPRCEQPSLDERDREGITIDVCPSCRGVWLDRGELEKLIARATRELDAVPYAGNSGYEDTPPRGVPRPGYGEAYDRNDPRGRKRSWLESLGDIFD